MTYDYIIIGAGLGGLSAGLNLVRKNKKVLILEKNSVPGGCVSTFRRGRFEFDTSISELYGYGSNTKKGRVRKVLDEYGIKLDVIENPDMLIHDNETGTELTLKDSPEEFVLELSKMVPNSLNTLKDLLKIFKDIHEGFEDYKADEYEEGTHKYFDKYLDISTTEALNHLKVPKKISEYLGFLWVYLGAPLNKISFIDFSDFMYNLLFKGVVTLKNKNDDLALSMADVYQKKGGKIYYRSNVTKIELGDKFDTVYVLGDTYKAKHIICNMSERYVYTNLISGDKNTYKRINAHTMSPSVFTVYLGLDKTYKDLGIKHYHYFMFDKMNSEECFNSLETLEPTTYEVVCPNVINDKASPNGTCIIELKAFFSAKAWQKIDDSNYLYTKDVITNYLVNKFEVDTGIELTPYIEEVDASSPITVSRFTNNIDGSCMGYARYAYDNSINRFINKDQEKGDISFVGSSSIYAGGAHNAILSGKYITDMLVKEDK